MRALGALLRAHRACRSAGAGVRINNGDRRDGNQCIWDLAVHDLSIIDLVVPAAPCAIAAATPVMPGRSRRRNLRVWFGEPLGLG
jgi:hypothetical protein